MHVVAFHGDPFLEQRSHGMAWGPSRDPFSGFVRSVLFYKNSTALFSCFFLFHSVDIRASGTKQCVCGGDLPHFKGVAPKCFSCHYSFHCLALKTKQRPISLKSPFTKIVLDKAGQINCISTLEYMPF